jgi:tetratricopeptide (TPR) repeat protein
VKASWLAASLLAAAGMLAVTGVSEARNPACAGGIQYVVQGLTDKGKGNTEDYQRQMGKAVQQLEKCAAEDPADYEAIGYLGWAYAETGAFQKAGPVFQTSIDGLTKKGDKKKIEWATTNRESYWANEFNRGIEAINGAQNAWPDYLKKPENDGETSLKTEATKKYDEAIASLQGALYLKPGDVRTLRNMGSVHAFKGEWAKAEEVLLEAQKGAPNDADLAKSIASIRANRAGALIDEGKYDEAIAFYQKQTAATPTDADLHLGLAEAYFKRAGSREGDAKKLDFKLAGDSYAKAGDLKPDNADLMFNAALAYTNAGEYALAEAQWRKTLKVRPEDADAQVQLGIALVELKKFDEAIKVLQGAVVASPKNKQLHRQLGATYSKAGNTTKGTEEYMMYLALQAGKPAADVATRTKGKAAGSGAAKTLAAEGAPDEIYDWESDAKKYETWAYWKKNMAYHLQDGAVVHKSDWSAAGATSKK